ncbi:MAG: hypothetical protein GC131_00670 [Alphaproteobacteria bacterium]|nr:hypothetical protein [Alphaproteobacteria bacterium]
MNELLTTLALFTTFTAIGAGVMCVLWLQKLRRALAKALNEATNQQIRTTQRLADAVSAVQRQQKMYEQQLHNLAQANMRLRQEVVAVAQRVERGESENRADNGSDRILH